MSGSDPTLLPSPELQFIDPNGVPYAGGTFALFVPGTTTPKDSWQDWQGTVLNTNPIVLDAAGRCIVWGDGDYRCILNDANGNLIFDQISTTLVSAAMVPVVSAPTLQAARDAMGVTAAIQTETNRAVNEEQYILTLIDGNLRSDLTAETTRAEAAEAHLQSEIDAEVARAEAAEAALGSSMPNYRTGNATTDASGNGTVTYDTPFPTHTAGIVATANGPAWIYTVAQTASGFTVNSMSPLYGGNWHGGPLTFYYIAFGS
jgi:hypothetical protein